MLYGVGLAVLAAVSVSGGIRLERNRQEALKTRKEHVSVIAVVNMDNGVAVENTQVNYAGQLLSFPNGHFTVTGLTDAKTGIENGKYAAYIVIPETFSASVTSVENDPAKVILSYQYNVKLDEEARLQAVSDINAFMALFNSNIAYMYMDAIMAEFHRIQDDSSTILANDNMELELIADIDAAELIAAVVPVEELPVQNNVQPVELTAYYSRSDALLSDMQTNYSAAVQKGKDDYDVIKEESAGVGAASEKFFGLYDTVIQETAAEQARSLADGRDKLSEAVGLYNQSADIWEAGVRDIAAKFITLQLEADREAAKNQLQKIVNDIKPDISGNDSDEEKGDSSKTSEGTEDSAGRSGEDTGKAGDQYEIVLSATADEEAVNSIVQEMLDLFQMEAESKEIDNVIQMYFVDALLEENKQQMTRLSEEMETVKESMESYERRLAEFDLMQYIGDANLNASLEEIDDNAREMLQTVEQNNSDYMLYASEMYTNTTEHTTQVRSALDEANTQTVRNVVDCMNDLALSRAQVNSLNVDLLKGFTESLAYTKVGSQANAEVYDYIINPIVPQINGQAVIDADTEVTANRREYSIKIWLVIILGTAILLCLTGIIVDLRRRNGRQWEESEELI